MFCREQVARLNERKAEIEARGATLAAVGNGTAHFAKAFKEDFDVAFPLFTDPRRESFAALGLKTDKRSIAKLSTMKNAARALKDGFRQGRTRGDPWQQGGVAVIDTNGALVYLHVDDVAGDHADIDEVLQAIPA